MAAAELDGLTLLDARRELAAGRLSAVELARAVLDRIEQVDGQLNAYLHLDPDDVLEQARAADRRNEGPLRGIPVCVKDIIDVAGLPTTAGAAGWRRRPARDATAVARLRAAGAVIVGKGNTNEFAYGADGLNPHWGDCRNPYDPALVSGGSSSGPAVATAAGMALAGLGSDTSGSIRIPASLCGLVGLRPTLGSVPTQGALALSWSYDTVGPLTRTVRDAAVVFGVLVGDEGVDELEPASEPSLRGVRVGLVEELIEQAEPAIAAGVRAAAARLEALGAEPVELRFELLHQAAAMHLVIQLVEASAAHAAWFDDQQERYAEPVRRLLEAGYLVPATRYLQAQQARRLLLEDVAATAAGVDVLLAPSTPVTAPRRDDDQQRIRASLLACTIPLTQLGWPALSVPIGFDAGLPYGLQIVGRPCSEPLLLRVGAALGG